jgi:hypothetical protein
MAGVTSSGFERATLREILAGIESAQRSEISPLFELSADRPEGQLNAILARAYAILWELAEIAYHAFDPDAAEGDQLENLSKLTGTLRRPASKSTVPLLFDLDEGTTIQAGVHFASVEGKPDARFTPVANFTAPDAGNNTYTLACESETAGPIAAASGTITTISTPVVGWTAVENEEDATVGRVQDSDATLRLRRQQGLTRAGGSTLDAVRADILAISEAEDDVNIQTVRILENETDAFVDDLPPHSFEAIVYDGTDGSDTELNNMIAQAIWDNRPIGIRAIGSTSGIAIDAFDEQHTVPFTRPSPVEIWIEYTIVGGPDFIGASDAALAIAVKCQELFPPGSSVIASHVRSIPFVLGLGVSDVTDFAIGIASNPSLDDNIPIELRDFAAFDSDRIEITVV